MPTVNSKDGTTIAYSKAGSGEPIILVDGAFGHRKFGPNGDLAEQLTPHFTVYTYDRRGRGESGDTAPYSIAREVEDIAALIEACGGSAHIFGISSGAALALEAARQNLKINKLAIYEAPFIVDDTRKALPHNYVARMDDLVAADKRGEAIKLFMSKGVGVPGIFVFMMQFMPAWKDMKSVAHTLIQDTALTAKYQQGQPLSREDWRNVTVHTQVICGGKSPDWMKNGMMMLANTLPDASHYTLDGQTHIVDAKALAPVLIDYFN